MSDFLNNYIYLNNYSEKKEKEDKSKKVHTL
jgi:hypothetical protein